MFYCVFSPSFVFVYIFRIFQANVLSELLITDDHATAGDLKGLFTLFSSSTYECSVHIQYRLLSTSQNRAMTTANYWFSSGCRFLATTSWFYLISSKIWREGTKREGGAAQWVTLVQTKLGLCNNLIYWLWVVSRLHTKKAPG